MLTIAPSFFASSGAACCAMKSGARRFEPISSSQCEASIAPTGDREEGRCVVHQEVEPAEALERRGDQRARRDRREQLGLHLRRAARARRVQLGLEPRRVGLGIAVVHAARSRPRRAGAARSPRRRAARRRSPAPSCPASDSSMNALDSRVDSPQCLNGISARDRRRRRLDLLRALHGARACEAYYGARRRAQFGAQGDFVTAPELGSAVRPHACAAAARARRPDPRARRRQRRARRDARCKELDREYLILETSAALRARQAARLGGRVKFLDRLPERFRGVVIANEVVDAMPVHAVAWRDERHRWSAACFAGKLAWKERAGERRGAGGGEERSKSRSRTTARSASPAAPGCAALAEQLERGAIFVIDYGFPRARVLPPAALDGHADVPRAPPRARRPVRAPGEQDITAHVDFSALAHAAREAGLEVLGYATQAQFLVNCGITDVLAEANVENALHYAPIAAEAQQLALAGGDGRALQGARRRPRREAAAPGVFTRRSFQYALGMRRLLLAACSPCLPRARRRDRGGEKALGVEPARADARAHPAADLRRRAAAASRNRPARSW